MIYAVRVKGTDYIKFGVAKIVEKRIQAIQTCCPFDLELIASCWGGYTHEALIHNRLVRAKAHIRGEWFRDCQEAQEIIEEMRRDSLGRSNQRVSRELIIANRRIRIPVVEEMPVRQGRKRRTTKQDRADPFPRARARDQMDYRTAADISSAVSSWFEQKRRSNAPIIQVKS